MVYYVRREPAGVRCPSFCLFHYPKRKETFAPGGSHDQKSMNTPQNNTEKTLRPELQIAITKTRTSSMNLIGAVAFSLINLIMIISGGNWYLPFSVSFTSFIVAVGQLLWQPTPDMEIPSLGIGVYVATIVIALLLLAVYVLCWWMSRPERVMKKPATQKSALAFSIVALVLYSLDCVFLVLNMDMSQILSEVIDIAFHAWVMYYLILGVKYYRKWQTLVEEAEKSKNTAPVDAWEAAYSDAPAEDNNDENKPE